MALDLHQNQSKYMTQGLGWEISLLKVPGPVLVVKKKKKKGPPGP